MGCFLHGIELQDRGGIWSKVITEDRERNLQERLSDSKNESPQLQIIPAGKTAESQTRHPISQKGN